jgi:hypothetical protein
MDTFTILQFVVMAVAMVAMHFMAERLTRVFAKVLGRYFPGHAIVPWLYEPINGVDLPEKHQRYFERYTPEFEQLGFQRIGDFVMRRDGQKLSTMRFFLNAEGTILGSLQCYLGSYSYGAVSLCADGLYVETGVLYPAPKRRPHVPMLMLIAHPKSIAGVVQCHAKAVEEHCLSADTAVLPMAPDDFREVLDYGHRWIARVMLEEGLIAELPEFAREKEAVAA